MENHVLKGTPDVTVFLRQSPRAKRISLRVSQLDGRVTLTLPKRASKREALAFLHDKELWIRRHLDNRQANIQVEFGSQLPLFGAPHHIRPIDGRRIKLENQTLFVPGKEEQLGSRLSRYFKELARDHLVQASDHYAQLLGKSYANIRIRDTRSRWGSCSSAGGLMYSWRLILAPPRVLKYVAAHEVAHLSQMNHSPDFWHEVSRIYGDYTEPRRWLKTHGNELHRYQFGN